MAIRPPAPSALARACGYGALRREVEQVAAEIQASQSRDRRRLAQESADGASQADAFVPHTFASN